MFLFCYKTVSSKTIFTTITTKCVCQLLYILSIQQITFKYVLNILLGWGDYFDEKNQNKGTNIACCTYIIWEIHTSITRKSKPISSACFFKNWRAGSVGIKRRKKMFKTKEKQLIYNKTTLQSYLYTVICESSISMIFFKLGRFTEKSAWKMATPFLIFSLAKKGLNILQVWQMVTCTV